MKECRKGKSRLEIRSPVKMKALNEEEQDSEGESLDEDKGQPDVPDTEEDESSLGSIAGQKDAARKELRMAQRKETKKQIEIFDDLRASERLAREVRWGVLKMSDG